jgi:DNA-directed RNA polymerase specialized sigma24 family protein
MTKSDDRQAGPSDRKPLAEVRLDLELMNALTAAEGKDNAALGELMIRHRGLVFNELRRWNIRRCDVDEVAGDVWNTVWRIGSQGKWSVDRARHVKDPFVPLLKRICDSRAKDFHRGVSRERKRQERVTNAFDAWGHDWREKLATPRRRCPRAERPEPAGVPAHLTGAVAVLPERLRTVYELHAKGFTNVKISGEVGCSKGEVSKRLNAAREALGLPTTRKAG